MSREDIKCDLRRSTPLEPRATASQTFSVHHANISSRCRYLWFAFSSMTYSKCIESSSFSSISIHLAEPWPLNVMPFLFLTSNYFLSGTFYSVFLFCCNENCFMARNKSSCVHSYTSNRREKNKNEKHTARWQLCFGASRVATCTAWCST